jgi:hypothetical protein
MLIGKLLTDRCGSRWTELSVLPFVKVISTQVRGQSSPLELSGIRRPLKHEYKNKKINAVWN